MIHVFYGENSFEIERAARSVVNRSKAMPEYHEGIDLSLSQLPELFAGQSLFGDARCIVIRRPSENKTLWTILPEWLAKKSDEVKAILIEGKLDKRTTSYKWLLGNASMHESQPWTCRQRNEAEEWVRVEGAKHGATLTHAHARELVGRVGFDQWQLFHAIEKLSLLPEIDSAAIESIIEKHPDENIFELLETALRGDETRIRSLCANLKQTEDAYAVFGLLSSQIMQLSALALSNGHVAEVAKDTGSAPFVLNKLLPYAARLNRRDVKQLLGAASNADRAMKSTSIDPWILVEKFLLEVVAIS